MWAAGCGEEIVITHESMTPRFTLDGIEYRAVRYSSHVRNIPILRVRCEVCDPSALAVEGDPKRLRVQRLLHYGLPMLVCLALAVVWVCTRNMPLWPDKAAMLLVLGALGIGYGFRGCIREACGSAEEYLAREYGLTPARRMRLRRMYLE